MSCKCKFTISRTNAMFSICLAYDSNVHQVTQSSNNCLGSRLILLKNDKAAGSHESREEKTLQWIWAVT